MSSVLDESSSVILICILYLIVSNFNFGLLSYTNMWKSLEVYIKILRQKPSEKVLSWFEGGRGEPILHFGCVQFRL